MTALLDLISREKTVKEITKMTSCNEKELFLNLIKMLEHQLLEEIDDNALFNAINKNLTSLVMSEKISKKVKLESLLDFESKLEGYILQDIPRAKSTKGSVLNLIQKLERNKSSLNRVKNDMYRKIIFEEKNFNKIKILFQKEDFDIRFLHHEHLAKWVFKEYIETFKYSSTDSEQYYYRKLLKEILSNYKFKLNEKELDVFLEKIKQTKKDFKVMNYPNAERVCKCLEITARQVMKNQNLKDPNVYPEKELERLDLTNEYTISIDTNGTENIDDALSIKRLPNGNFRLGIHVADVMGNKDFNFRLNHRFIEELKSNGPSEFIQNQMFSVEKGYSYKKNYFSLKKNKNKRTLSLFLEITEKGEIIDYDFAKAIINVDANIPSEDVNWYLKTTFFKEKEQKTKETLEQLAKVIIPLRDLTPTNNILTSFIRYKRTNSPSLQSENYIDFEQYNLGTEIPRVTMIIYNTFLAQHCNKKGHPMLYKNVLANDYVLSNPEKAQAILNHLSPKYDLCKSVKELLWLYPKASYSIRNEGNAIMDADAYFHASSPIISRYNAIAQLALDRAEFNPYPDKELVKLEEKFNLIAGLLNFQAQVNFYKKKKESEVSKDIKKYVLEHKKVD